MIQTQEQQAITTFSRGNIGSLIVEALAGTGKTTTLIEIIKVLLQPSTLVLAFNKLIAQDMLSRLPPMPKNRVVHVKTLHAAGYWITKKHFPGLSIDRDITEQRIREAAGDGTPFRVLGASTKLLRLVKDFQHARKLNLDETWVLGHEFDVFAKLAGPHEVQRVVEIVDRAYRASLEVGKVIDFPDQGWLPLVLDLEPPSRYKAIVLDEAQDINENQLAMVERLLAPGGRIIAAGDLNQQIYGWRGAAGREVWERLIGHHKARRFPLTITWRCDKAIVAQANELVPTLRARPDAGPGAVYKSDEGSFYSTLDATNDEGGTIFVLSRNNAELLRVALEMWRRKLMFNVAQSGDMLTPIKTILNKLLKDWDTPRMPTIKPGEDAAIEEALSLFHLRRQQGESQAASMAMKAGVSTTPAKAQFQQKLAAWYMSESMKAQGAGSASWAERIEDQHKMILYALAYVRDPREIEGVLENIFLYDDACWITLSTVHKAKGLEADHVYLLRETFRRHQNRRDRDGNKLPVDREELNVEYVAITRARKSLTWVTLDQGAAT